METADLVAEWQARQWNSTDRQWMHKAQQVRILLGFFSKCSCVNELIMQRLNVSTVFDRSVSVRWGKLAN